HAAATKKRTRRPGLGRRVAHQRANPHELARLVKPFARPPSGLVLLDLLGRDTGTSKPPELLGQLRTHPGYLVLADRLSHRGEHRPHTHLRARVIEPRPLTDSVAKLIEPKLLGELRATHIRRLVQMPPQLPRQLTRDRRGLPRRHPVSQRLQGGAGDAGRLCRLHARTLRYRGNELGVVHLGPPSHLPSASTRARGRKTPPAA